MKCLFWRVVKGFNLRKQFICQIKSKRDIIISLTVIVKRYPYNQNVGADLDRVVCDNQLDVLQLYC